MSSRALLVLGSASQVPTKHRNHNGYLLRWDAHGLLFDPGEGTQRQFTRFGVPVSAVDRVLVSHFHGDHCLGLPGIVQRFSLDQVVHRVPVHYPASGQVYFDRLRHASIFDDRADVVAAPVRDDGVIAELDDLRIEARRLDHRVEAFGYRVVEPDGVRFLSDRLQAAGVRGADVGRLSAAGAIEIDGRTVQLADVTAPRPGQKAAFVMDTRLCDAAVALAADADLLICESTYLASEADLARAYGHMTADEAGRLAKEAGVRRLVLTHFSRRYADVAAFVDEAGRHCADVVAAEDGAVIPVPPRA